MTLLSGTSAPALPLVITATLPADVVDTARGFLGATQIGVTSTDMAASLVGTAGQAAVPLPLENVKFPETAVPASSGQTMTITTPALTSTAPPPAAVKAMTVPAAGTYAVNLPKTFTLDSTKQGGAALVSDIPCTLQAGATSTLGQITVTDKPVDDPAKGDATVTAKAAKKKVKAGKAVKVKVSVASTGSAVPTGDVTASVKGKNVATGTLDSSGMAKLKIKKLKASKKKTKKYTITVSYAGDSATDAATTTVKVKVLKKKSKHKK